jgi:hypothetical protein
MSIRTILVASILASLGAFVGQESAVFAQPVLPPPPAPMYQPEPEPEPAYPPPAPSYSPQQQPAQPYPPAQQPVQPYPAPQQPAQPYPPPAQPAPAYPPPQQPATGYPQPGQGYPPPQPQGYPPPQPQGYPPPQPQGYPPAQPQGYPPPQTQGYPPPQQGYPPPQQQDYPAPVPAPVQPAPKAESIFADPLSKLQVGFHLATGSIDTPDDAVRRSDFSSYGIFARYRFNERWEAELAVASEGGTMEANRAKREFRPITASGLWHVFNLRGVDLYGRFGLGRSTEVYDHPDFKALEAPATHFHIGAGGSYIFRRNIGAGLEIRQQWINRSSTESIEELSGRGMAYSLVGSYHF